MENQQMVEIKRARIIQIVYIAIVVGLGILFLKYVFPVIAPFIIAFVIAAMCMPIVRFLARKTRIKSRQLWGLVVIFSLYATIGTLLTLLLIQIVNWLIQFVTNLPQLYFEKILPALEKIKQFSADSIERISPENAEQYHVVLNDTMKFITSKAIDLSGDLASALTSFSLALPSFLLMVFFALLASIFITWDYENIIGFMKRQMSDKTEQRVIAIIKTFTRTIRDYVAAYALIACITAIELSIGFLIIGLPNAILVALGIAVFDMIPIFGTGGIMMPWIAIAFLNGNTTLGIQLLVIYSIVSIVRNVIEPKIVGKKLGLNTVVALFVMFIGLQLFGILGMIFAPILTVMVINFKESENMNWWK
ncbi:sporulation integral membrane protein YtvI [Lysinibacillus alkalisoli]|uniref:Sporulation integral membrane protein YtvI n=1 Tax=Lysinibacillus alkalisoli TaxID=1911548 RepID=A0A917G098_9BACI|nr:sporulation integral membrane protein YtvI [Lysinibacillus alkalisoli]GGG16023.1 sporulation integral membrane protein YtvI [Lysinibacillus alkalisoli]